MQILYSVIIFLVYSFTQSGSIYGGDAGDLVTAAYNLGVAHPPGFPLYTFLGHLLTKLPIGSVAFRVSFASSIPASLTIGLLYLVLKKLTKDNLASLIASLILAFTYPFWLYSVVPEVFGLNSFFSILLIFLLIRWLEKKTPGSFYLFLFVLGLAVSHQQIILFLSLGFFYLIFKNKKILGKISLAGLIKDILIAGSGFIFFYFYVFWAALKIPVINWDNTVNLPNIIRLITRADYGTFVSMANFGKTFFSRFLQLAVYGDFVLRDFTIVGTLLAGLGMIALFKKKRRYFIYFILLWLFSGPIYFFYASYMLSSGFNIATYEKFLSFSFLIIAIFIGFGISLASSYMASIFRKIGVVKIKEKELLVFCRSLFFILPVILIYVNYPKISYLKKDMTAENYGADLLNSLEKDSIFLPIGDIALFNSQYVRYVLGIRQDVILLHGRVLMNPQYNPWIKKYFPSLVTNNQGSVAMFIKDNYSRFPIYSNTSFELAIDNGFWVQKGLVYKFYLKKDLPGKEAVILDNKEIWKKYHDPLDSEAGKYQNLFLASVLSAYARAKFEAGVLSMKEKYYKEALVQFKELLKLDKSANSYYQLGRAYLFLDQCPQAKSNLEQTIKLDKNTPDGYLALGIVYKQCFQDDNKAKYYFEEFVKKSKAKETPVEKL